MFIKIYGADLTKTNQNLNCIKKNMPQISYYTQVIRTMPASAV